MTARITETNALLAGARELDRAHRTAVAQQIHEAARALWSLRVLDAWEAATGGHWTMGEGACVLDSWCVDGQGNPEEPKIFNASKADASRALAAIEVWSDLDETDQTRIGKCP